MNQEESLDKKSENKDNNKIKESIDHTENKKRIGGNGWRDILDELECSNGPGDNIYVFG